MESKLVKSDNVRGVNPKAMLSFLKAVEKALSEGWELPKECSLKDFPKFRLGLSVYMYKEDKKAKPEEPKELDLLEVIKDPKLKAAELYEIADKSGIELDPNFKQPAQVRKHLKAAILAKREDGADS